MSQNVPTKIYRITSALTLGVLFLAAIPAPAHDVSDAHTQFVRLLDDIRAAHRRDDPTAALSKSLELAALLHQSGPATEQVAMAYADLGKRRQAIEWLSNFAAMGQADDGLESNRRFRSILYLPQLKRIVAAMRRNGSPIDRSAAVIQLRDAGLLPEDIDYDATSRSYLVTSVLKKEILRVGTGGLQKVFSRAPDGWPILAVKVDARRALVWATEVAVSGFAGVPRRDWGRSMLLCLQLKDGSVVRKLDVPRTALGDMALMPNGDIIVSDGDNGGVYRARAGCTDGALQRIDRGQFISPQTPAPLPDGRHVFVPDYARGVALLDVVTGSARWVKAGHAHTLHGIDGMYLISKGLLCVQNGAVPERVVLFGLDDALQVSDERVIDRSSPTLGDPTHGVIVDGAFYYIANSGWPSLDDRGGVKSGSGMTPAYIKRISVANL